MKPPTVDDARALGKRLDVTHLVIIAVDEESGDLSYASYGKTRALCGQARRLADRLYETTEEFFVP